MANNYNPGGSQHSLHVPPPPLNQPVPQYTLNKVEYQDPLRQEPKSYEYKEYQGHVEIPVVKEYKYREYNPHYIDPLTGKSKGPKASSNSSSFPKEIGSPVGSMKRTLKILDF